jgi:hypothetical protein
MARQVLTCRRAAETARGTGKITEHIGDGRDFIVQGCGERFAAVLRFQPGQLLAMGLDGIGDCQQRHRALFGAGLRPPIKSLVGGSHGGIDLCLGGLVDLCQGATLGGVEHSPCRAFAGYQMTVDQHFDLHRGLLMGHLPLPATLSPPRVR